jgi:hypothetical protein
MKTSRRGQSAIEADQVSILTAGEIVNVRIPSDLSCTGKARWKLARIDACIAPLVRALQKGGVDMRGSCCGHGAAPGQIALADGRLLLVIDPETAQGFLDGSVELHVSRINRCVGTRQRSTS